MSCPLSVKVLESSIYATGAESFAHTQSSLPQLTGSMLEYTNLLFHLEPTNPWADNLRRSPKRVDGTVYGYSTNTGHSDLPDTLIVCTDDRLPDIEDLILEVLSIANGIGFQHIAIPLFQARLETETRRYPPNITDAEMILGAADSMAAGFRIFCQQNPACVLQKVTVAVEPNSLPESVGIRDISLRFGSDLY